MSKKHEDVKIKWDTVRKVLDGKPLVEGCYCHICGFDWTDDAGIDSWAKHLKDVHNLFKFQVNDAEFVAERINA